MLAGKSKSFSALQLQAKCAAVSLEPRCRVLRRVMDMAGRRREESLAYDQRRDRMQEILALLEAQ
jgi:hypothetical protein